MSAVSTDYKEVMDDLDQTNNSICFALSNDLVFVPSERILATPKSKYDNLELDEDTQYVTNPLLLFKDVDTEDESKGVSNINEWLGKCSKANPVETFVRWQRIESESVASKLSIIINQHFPFTVGEALAKLSTQSNVNEVVANWLVDQPHDKTLPLFIRVLMPATIDTSDENQYVTNSSGFIDMKLDDMNKEITDIVFRKIRAFCHDNEDNVNNLHLFLTLINSNVSHMQGVVNTICVRKSPLPSHMVDDTSIRLHLAYLIVSSYHHVMTIWHESQATVAPVQKLDAKHENLLQESVLKRENELVQLITANPEPNEDEANMNDDVIVSLPSTTTTTTSTTTTTTTTTSSSSSSVTPVTQETAKIPPKITVPVIELSTLDFKAQLIISALKPQLPASIKKHNIKVAGTKDVWNNHHDEIIKMMQYGVKKLYPDVNFESDEKKKNEDKKRTEEIKMTEYVRMMKEALASDIVEDTDFIKAKSIEKKSKK